MKINLSSLVIKMHFLKWFANVFVLMMVFLIGYLVSLIKSDSDIKSEVYSVAISSFSKSAMMSAALLGGGDVYDLNDELMRKCMFVSYYNDYNDFVGWMERDSPFFWKGTHNFEPVESYRRIAIKEFGTDDLRDFYNEKCFPIIWPK